MISWRRRLEPGRSRYSGIASHLKMTAKLGLVQKKGSQCTLDTILKQSLPATPVLGNRLCMDQDCKLHVDNDDPGTEQPLEWSFQTSME